MPACFKTPALAVWRGGDENGGQFFIG